MSWQASETGLLALMGPATGDVGGRERRGRTRPSWGLQLVGLATRRPQGPDAVDIGWI